ncbi:MAG: hypothetical protein GY810_21815 [Aureispira sp.]|nr:hypothetical protein [Aureispira sp.]
MGLGAGLVDIIGGAATSSKEQKIDALETKMDQELWEYQKPKKNESLNSSYKYVSIALVLLLFLFLFKTIDPLDKNK